MIPLASMYPPKEKMKRRTINLEHSLKKKWILAAAKDRKRKHTSAIIERGQCFDKNTIFNERAAVSTTLGLECVRVRSKRRVAPLSFTIFTLSSVVRVNVRSNASICII
jgi:hypothetical protein